MYEGEVDNFHEFNIHGQGTIYLHENLSFTGEFNKYTRVGKGVFADKDGWESNQAVHLISTLSNLDICFV